MPKKVNRDAQILIRVPGKIKDELQREAEKHSRSLSDFCCLALIGHLNRLTEVAMKCRFCAGHTVKIKDRELCQKCGKEQ